MYLSLYVFLYPFSFIPFYRRYYFLSLILVTYIEDLQVQRHTYKFALALFVLVLLDKLLNLSPLADHTHLCKKIFSKHFVVKGFSRIILHTNLSNLKNRLCSTVDLFFCCQSCFVRYEQHIHKFLHFLQGGFEVLKL